MIKEADVLMLLETMNSLGVFVLYLLFAIGFSLFFVCLIDAPSKLWKGVVFLAASASIGLWFYLTPPWLEPDNEVLKCAATWKHVARTLRICVAFISLMAIIYTLRLGIGKLRMRLKKPTLPPDVSTES